MRVGAGYRIKFMLKRENERRVGAEKVISCEFFLQIISNMQKNLLHFPVERECFAGISCNQSQNLTPICMVAKFRSAAIIQYRCLLCNFNSLQCVQY